MLGLLYAGLPVLLKPAAIALMWNFPLDTAAQKRVRETIEARQRPVILESSAK
jgi:GPH family glycoside/pentoside/hexuronide:cation symporter